MLLVSRRLLLPAVAEPVAYVQEDGLNMRKSYNGVAVPSNGQQIEFIDDKFRVPDQPIIPFIEGDGTGRDIWKASRRVFDAAVEKVYGGKKKIAWLEVFAGEKSFNSSRTGCRRTRSRPCAIFASPLRGR